jgi:crotonobetainyl-CoA:carnitine CoA-transferase CaiB-like acyl-CoA transferase
MLADPQLEAREMIVSITHPTAGDVRLMGNPVRMSGDGSRPDAPPPWLGEHTDGILTELGVGANELSDLRRAGVV